MKRISIAALLVLAPILFCLGVSLPLLSFERLYFFRQDPSLLEMIGGLYGNGDLGLAAVVSLVSILFPIVKMMGVAWEAVSPADARQSRLAKLLALLGKWSMMDVLLVAIVIVAAKTSGLAEAFSRPGLWFYAGSTLSVSALQWLIAPRAGR